MLESLREARLLTLTGPAGTGKTRLALRVARRAGSRFPDGVWWVELAPIARPEVVPAAISTLLGLREMSGRTPLETIVDRLSGAQALLVLDNCEHLVASCAEFVEALLLGCPDVRLLATSRERLAVSAEVVWQVPPLEEGEASDLFEARATSLQRDFRVGTHNEEAVREICRGVEGIPLAIELAAARIRVLAPAQIAERLGDQLSVLGAGGADAVPRLRTLEASIAWSHDLLSEQERVLFRRLAAFAGGWTLEAAEQVCADGDVSERQVLDLLGGLVDKSLVTAERSDQALRYSFLESVRQYAVAQLAEAGEEDEVRARHLHVFVTLAQQAAPLLVTRSYREHLPVLTTELGNLRAAAEHAVRTDPCNALMLATALWQFWHLSGRFIEGLEMLRLALEAGREQPPALRAYAFITASDLATWAGRREEAAALVSEALAAAEEAEDPMATANALSALSHHTMLSSEPTRARELATRSIELARAGNFGFPLSLSLYVTAFSWIHQDRYAIAETTLAEAAEVGEWAGSPRPMLALHLHGQAWCALYSGELERSNELATRGVQTARETAEPLAIAVAACFLAQTAAHLGELQDARRTTMTALEEAHNGGAGLGKTWLNQALALVEASEGELDAAASRLNELVADPEAWAWQVAYCEGLLAWVLLAAGDVSSAEAHAEKQAALARRLESPLNEAHALELLGRCALAEGEHGRAGELLHEAVALNAEFSFKLQLPYAIEGLAEAAAAAADWTRAARLLGAAAAIRRARRSVRLIWPQNGDGAEARTVEAIGKAAFDDAFGEGEHMPEQEAITWTLRGRGARKRPPSGWDSLTPAEQEVVGLVAQGFSNPEIGARLFTSRATVKTHLTHIFRKLDVSSRSQLAAEVARRPHEV